jgi:hypothetical protein
MAHGIESPLTSNDLKKEDPSYDRLIYLPKIKKYLPM